MLLPKSGPERPPTKSGPPKPPMPPPPQPPPSRTKGLRRMMIVLILLWLLGFWLASAFSGQIVNDVLATKPFGHHIWQDVLSRHVSREGAVDFAMLRAHPRRFNEYLAQLAQFSPENHPEYFPAADDILAYWINAYNAMALRMALNHYPKPVEPPNPDEDIQSLPYKLGGRYFSMAELRHRVMDRYAFYPGVIFALTDYTKDAPPVLHEAYVGKLLNKQLQQAAQQTMVDPEIIQFTKASAKCPQIRLSSYWIGKSDALQLNRDEDAETQSTVYSKPKPDDEPSSPEEPTKNGKKGGIPSKGPSDEPSPDASQNAGVWAGDQAQWAIKLQPFAPPGYKVDWQENCKQAVIFVPPTKELRVLTPLEDAAPQEE